MLMWPWSQRQGRTCIEPIYSSYSEFLCHFLSESVHIWQNDSLWCIVCLIWSCSSQSIFFSQVISGWLFLGLNWHLAGFNVSCLSCLFLAALWSTVGKGLTSRLPCMWCFLVVFCHLPIPYRVLGHVCNLIVSMPYLCLLLYFAHEQYAVPPVRLKPATLLSRLKHSTTGYSTRILCCEQMKVSDYCYDLGVKGLGQYLTNVDVNSLNHFC